MNEAYSISTVKMSPIEKNEYFAGLKEYLDELNGEYDYWYMALDEMDDGRVYLSIYPQEISAHDDEIGDFDIDANEVLNGETYVADYYKNDPELFAKISEQVREEHDDILKFEFPKIAREWGFQRTNSAYHK